MLARNTIVHSLARASVSGALLLILAASSSAQEAPKKPSDKPRREEVKLVVENNNYWDMHMYAMEGGLYRSLGIVPGLGEEELTVPAYLAAPGADFQILADPIGSNVSYMTDPILLGTSDEIDLMIQGDIALSSFMLTRRSSGRGSD